MALVFSTIESKILKVISSKDDSLMKDDDFESKYQSYLEDLDESKLKFIEGKLPTYFHLQTASSQKDILKQKDSMASMAMQAQKTGEMPIFSMMCATVKVALKDITTGPDSQMNKGKHGLVSDDIMTWLVANDVVAELFNALEQEKQSGNSKDIKKK